MDLFGNKKQGDWPADPCRPDGAGSCDGALVAARSVKNATRVVIYSSEWTDARSQGCARKRWERRLLGRSVNSHRVLKAGATGSHNEIPTRHSTAPRAHLAHPGRYRSVMSNV